MSANVGALSWQPTSASDKGRVAIVECDGDASSQYIFKLVGTDNNGTNVKANYVTIDNLLNITAAKFTYGFITVTISPYTRTTFSIPQRLDTGKLDLGAGIIRVIFAEDNLGIPDEQNQLASGNAYNMGIYFLRDGTTPALASFDFGTFKGTNLARSTIGTDATNKNYVDEKTGVSIFEYSNSTDPAVGVNAAIAAGKNNIVIPLATNWVQLTPIVIPYNWRGTITHISDKTNATAIFVRTGNNIPCIDMQGSLLCTIQDFHVVADVVASAPACFIVMARMGTGASSGNHTIRNNIVEGHFKYCCLYNVGCEELYFENNYWNIYDNANASDKRIATVVHTLNEDAYYTNIQTKDVRTNGTSTSAIDHNSDVFKNFKVGASMIVIGNNANDIVINGVYGTSPQNSFGITSLGFCDGIKVNIDRFEGFKNSPFIYLTHNLDIGCISIVGGAYRRDGAVDNTKYFVEIGGGALNLATVTIDKSVQFTSNYGGAIEDIYLIRATRTICLDVDVSGGGPVGTFLSSRVDVTKLINSCLTIGQRSGLTVGTYVYNSKLSFLFDATKANDFYNGVNVIGDGYYFNGTKVVGARQGAVASPAGGATIDAQSRTAIDAIRNVLIAHGLTA